MASKAVAATLACIVIFTVILVAGSSLVMGEDNLLAGLQSSRIESRQALEANVIMGSTSLQLLYAAGNQLQATPANCTFIPAYLASIKADWDGASMDEGTEYSVLGTAAYTATPGSAPDNLSMVAPFEGTDPGEFNMKADVHVSASGAGGLVVTDKRETHWMHLPIHPEEASALCQSIAAALQQALPPDARCNYSTVAASYSSTVANEMDQAAARGFRLGVGWTMVDGSGGGCSVRYWITLVEPGARGVRGTFDWTVEGSGTAPA